MDVSKLTWKNVNRFTVSFIWGKPKKTLKEIHLQLLPLGMVIAIRDCQWESEVFNKEDYILDIIAKSDPLDTARK